MFLTLINPRSTEADPCGHPEAETSHASDVHTSMIRLNVTGTEAIPVQSALEDIADYP